jgi:hypothetical protein
MNHSEDLEFHFGKKNCGQTLFISQLNSRLLKLFSPKNQKVGKKKICPGSLIYSIEATNLILRKCGVDKNLTYLLNMLTFDA